MRRLFIDGYDDLKTRLTKRLGSADLAGEAMHDTWLRLARLEPVGVVQQPEHYLFRAALNAADDHRRREKRHSRSVDLDRALEIRDERPTAEEDLVARSELETFETIMAELPPRRRAIFLAARVGNVPRQVIADEMRISRRSVARELMLAHKHCLARWKELVD
ncbi:sigma-70 family RNA polymerase sigma factor [Rhodoplanes sp.]|uniref:RNA polymerase sigma factor n=1 Tax=Rhodoplanes sp. TaxID=1968906 RepID=UPI0025F2382B|nr:sigma-70 family RNA polymerase sigma factor [Rhodoplanes sp.]